MNRTDFLNMIDETVPVSRQMIGEVYELINIFPYFQSAHLLLLKGLQNITDVKFENQLRNSAIYIADREVLYYRLNTKPFPEAESDNSKEEKSMQENPVSDIQQEVPVKETQQEVPVNETQQEVPVNETQQELPVNEMQQEVPVNETQQEVPVNDTQQEIPVYDTQQNVIESAKNSEYLIDEIEKNSNDSYLKENQNADNQAPGHSVLISSDSETDEYTGVMMLVDEESSTGDDKIFYMDPGFSVDDHNDDLLELDLEQELELELDNNTFNIIDAIEASGEQFNQEVRNADKQSQFELIDKFIIANPRIEPIKEKTSQPTRDITEKFVEDGGGFVTETLAKIYINQGYYSRAIDVYEKLSLKFPEKSSYFASQIEKVKEYLKQ